MWHVCEFTKEGLYMGDMVIFVPQGQLQWHNGPGSLCDCISQVIECYANTQCVTMLVEIVYLFVGFKYLLKPVLFMFGLLFIKDSQVFTYRTAVDDIIGDLSIFYNQINADLLAVSKNTFFLIPKQT